MLWLRVPEKVYFKKGCMPVALDELKTVYNKKKAFIVAQLTDYKNGSAAAIEALLDKMRIQHTAFFDIDGTAQLKNITDGARTAQLFEPDVIIAFGGGSIMQAAKLIRLLYEHETAELRELASRFGDIRKREELFPRTNVKASLVTIPTSSGTGEEVTPYACVKDGENRITLADYELMPEFVVVDSDCMISQTREQIAASACAALVHIFCAYASENATEYTDGFAQMALRNIAEYLPSYIENGAEDPIGCEKLSYASAMSGIAYANTQALLSCPKKAVTTLADDVLKNAEQSPQQISRYAQLAFAAGIGEGDETERVKALSEKLGELTRLCGF